MPFRVLEKCPADTPAADFAGSIRAKRYTSRSQTLERGRQLDPKNQPWAGLTVTMESPTLGTQGWGRGAL
jgi:hypothetical protein